MLDKCFKLNLNGKCNSDSVVQGEKYRFTVLTPQMLRMEYSEDGVFEDRPTQIVWNRNFDNPEFQVIDLPGRLEISTDYFHLVYNKKEFSPNNLYIDIKCAYTNYGGRWQFGATEYGNPPREHNLKGTARTLDRIDGSTELEFGLLDSSGRAFFDDSNSLIITDDGWVEQRKKGVIDYYYFGYGRDYFKAIKDFYKLSGEVPLLPKYVLGNWWSRYWPYTEKSYMELLERFKEEDMPFSVAVMDMDWHLVDVREKYGRGWTGYTWNKDFFPDPERFLTWLHENNMKVTLNLHPADGVRDYEDAYIDIAKELGADYKNGEPVLFDISNPKFMEAYFKYLHHPQEKIGVDFWWMDWQQGKTSAVDGLDPLWMLNHYHTYDIQRNGKRPMLLSRYCGLGSHRYPIGFSGDTVISWESLDFQPYFTATASNVGYTWWSHDIGGHMRGIRDDELMTRWVQFGAFSPINRLHSTNSPFGGKEPWLFDSVAENAIKDMLVLRHKMIPYIYTMNWRCHNDLIPFIIPMYYYYPANDESYEFKNQYFFGSELMVCPITSKNHKSTKMGSVKAWIPDGIWTDLFTGFVYNGDLKTVLNRPLNQIPVLAKAGAIVPMAAHVKHSNSIENPKLMEIYVFPGASNSFHMYEDESDNFNYQDGTYAMTHMKLDWSDNRAIFTLTSEGDLSVIPEKREYKVMFRGFNDTDDIIVNVPFTKTYCAKTRTVEISLDEQPVDEKISIEIKSDMLTYDNKDMLDRIFDFIIRTQMNIDLKTEIYKCFSTAKDKMNIVSYLNTIEIDKPVLDTLLEIMGC